MLRLLLLRHAKAVPHNPTDDRGRRLAEQGLRDARRMGRYLAEQKWPLDLALVSPAARTRETFDQVGLALGKKVEVVSSETLYHAEAADLLAAVASTPRSVKTVLVVGHNPAIADLARALAGAGDSQALAQLRRRFPTSALAVIDFKGKDWSSIAPGAGRLQNFVTPAILDGGDDPE